MFLHDSEQMLCPPTALARGDLGLEAKIMSWDRRFGNGSGLCGTQNGEDCLQRAAQQT